MKTDLSHLPHAKQRELGHIVQFLFEEFADAIVMAEGKRKAGRILKIILFGSHARGDWVNEPHTAKGYVSDYDLLVIVNQQELADLDLWHNAEERLIRETQVTKVLRTPANFIVHSLKDVNDALAQGRFFFMDIARDGIALYQSSETELHQPKPQEPGDALEMAQEYFEEWFPSAVKRFETARLENDLYLRIIRPSPFVHKWDILLCPVLIPDLSKADIPKPSQWQLRSDAKTFDKLVLIQ